jgi:cystathionine beta-lyase/cystathionine gamma-synthase
MDEEARKAAGSSTDLIRVSVGIESVADIINDFKAGLKAVEKATS